MKVRLVDRLVYVVARLAIGTAARVPQWLGYGCADLLGRLFFRLDRRRRGYAMHFLRNAFPELDDAARARLGARATGNLFKVPIDMARLTRLLARGGDVLSVLDLGAVGKRIAGLKPPFLGLTAHLGNWEVAAAGVARAVGGAHGMARVSKNPLLQKWLLANRQRGGLIIHPRRGGVRDLASALARGGVGLQVVDQNQRLRGVFATFFGQMASCERAGASLALRRGYPILVGVALRRGRGFRFEMVSTEPFVLENTGDRARDLQVGVERINRAIEELVRMAPEQYLWIHDRYRTKSDKSESDDAGADGDSPRSGDGSDASDGESVGESGDD